MTKRIILVALLLVGCETVPNASDDVVSFTCVTGEDTGAPPDLRSPGEKRLQELIGEAEGAPVVQPSVEIAAVSGILSTGFGLVSIDRIDGRVPSMLGDTLLDVQRAPIRYRWYWEDTPRGYLFEIEIGTGRGRYWEIVPSGAESDGENKLEILQTYRCTNDRSVLSSKKN